MLPWIYGGSIPLFPARTYLNEERKGTSTPDELIRTSKGATVHDVSRFIKHPLGASITIKDLSIGFNDGRGLLPVDYESKPISGYILSLSNNYNRDTQTKLEKACCMKIKDVNTLSNALANQLGVACESGPISYTTSDNRDVFLKSWKDRWQDEYRLFFPIMAENCFDRVFVNLPVGIALTDRVDRWEWRI